jgi:hypothetical protein
VIPRFALILALTIVGSQCTNRPASPVKTEQASPATPLTSNEPIELTNASQTELHRYVGKMVTLRGKFSLRGVIAPYIQLGSANIYIKPKGSYYGARNTTVWKVETSGSPARWGSNTFSLRRSNILPITSMLKQRQRSSI